MKRHHEPVGHELRALALTIAPVDLPAGWSDVGDRSWRLGGGFPRDKSEAVRRAHAAQLFAAVRFLKKSQVPRGFWTQVAEFTSPEDAASRVALVPAQLLAESGRTVVREEVFTDVTVPGVADSLVFEQVSTGREGSVVGQYACGSEGSVLFTVACTTTDFGQHDERVERWPLSDLLLVAERQADKIRRVTSETAR